MLVLGIDYSTESCGLTVMDQFKNIHHLQGITFYKLTKKERRHKMQDAVREIQELYELDFILLESIRLFSQGIINLKSIFALASMVVTIANVSKVPVYGVDTRSWKARILGKAKADKNDGINYVEQTYNIMMNDNHDLADSVCIAEMGIRYNGTDLLKFID